MNFPPPLCETQILHILMAEQQDQLEETVLYSLDAQHWHDRSSQLEPLITGILFELN